MQQQFFTLSPMAGQESFGHPLDVRPGMMAHTPTTSSMLAALQADTFGSLDPTSGSFGSDAFSSMTFVDPTGTPDDSSAFGSSLAFSDYVSGASGFDVSGFAHPELGIGASGTPPSSSEPDSEPETKSEPGH